MVSITIHLIPRDKYPGIRPIGIGETLREVVGKAICLAAKSDAEKICGVNLLRRYVV